MSDIVHSFGDGTTPLVNDPNPNTTAPDTDRKFDTPYPSAPVGSATLYVVAQGGGVLPAITLRIWQYSEALSRWFAKGSAGVSVAIDQVTVLGEVPRGVKLTVQVTGNVGVTKLGFGYMGDGP